LVYIKQAFVVLFSFVGEILVSIMSNKSRPNYSASFQQQSDGFDEELELAANPESGSVTLVDEGRRGTKYIVALLAAGNMHGMPVGFLLGLYPDAQKLPQMSWFPEQPLMSPNEIVYIGLR
jgi:hypothetical protein